MADKTQSFLPKTNVDMAHWAKMTKDQGPAPDAPGEAVYGEISALPGMVQVALAVNSQTGTYYADGNSYATATQLGDITCQVQCPDLPPAVRSEWFGQKYESGLLREGQINPIDLAFGYRITKSNGAMRYIWLLKAKPTAPDETVNTKTNSINFQDGTITLAAAMRYADGNYRVMVDSDDPNLPEGITTDILDKFFFADPNFDPATFEIPTEA